MKHLLARILAVILLTFVALLGASGTATAAVVDDQSGTGGTGVCGSKGDSPGEDLLPVNRWQDSMDFHSRLGWGFGDQLNRAAREGTLSIGMGVGNFAWSSATGLVQGASQFCPLYAVGGLLDKTFYSLAKAVFGSLLLTMFAVVSIILYIWRLYSHSGGGSDVKMLWQKALVIGLLAIMTAGASQSTGGMGPGSAGGSYKPGPMSPGWFVTTIDTITADITGEIVDSIPADSSLGASSATTGGLWPEYSRSNPYSCESYIKSMKDGYRTSMAGSSTGAASIPLSVNAYWEQTGLSTWKKLQFGTESNYGNIMWCRVLEANRPSPSKTYLGIESADKVPNVMPQFTSIEAIMDGAGVKIDPRAPAWAVSSDNANQDIVFVAWAACAHNGSSDSTTGWKIPAGSTTDRTSLWRGDAGDTAAQAAACNALFNSPADYGAFDDFDWGNGGKDAENDMENGVSGTGAYAGADFVRSLHGAGAAGGIVTMIVYTVASLLLFVVFAGFSIAIIFAKIYALLFMIGMLFALLWSLMPSGDINTVGKYLRKYVGISFFAYSAGLLLAIVTTITNILVLVGAPSMPGGPGGVLATLWIGLAPTLAVVSLHVMFKQLGVPSPMSVKSVGAWGKAAQGGNLGAAVGGAVAGGATAEALSRFRRRGTSKLARAGKDLMFKRGGKGAASVSVPAGAGKQELPPVDAADKTDKMVGAIAGKQKGSSSRKERRAKADEEFEQRRAEREARKEERKARKEWEASDEGKAAAAEAAAQAQQARTPEARKAAKDERREAVKTAALRKTQRGLHGVSRQFREKPLRTAAKVVVGATVAAPVAAAAVAAAPVVAAGAVGGTAIFAGRKRIVAGTKKTASATASAARTAAEATADRAVGTAAVVASKGVTGAASKSGREQAREHARARRARNTAWEAQVRTQAEQAREVAEYHERRQRATRASQGSGGTSGDAAAPVPVPAGSASGDGQTEDTATVPNKIWESQ